MEKTYTEEQIRAAMGPVLNCSHQEEQIIAALTTRKLRPDVPVLLKYENGDIHVCCASEARTASDTVSVDALIPVDMAMDECRRALGIHAQQPTRGMVIEELQKSLDAYQYGEEAR